MHAAMVTAFGDVPRYTEIDDPTAADGIVVGRVLAASLKNLDRALVAGTHYGSAGLTLPFVPGIDGVAELDDGRRVYGTAVAPHGMMAEQAALDPARVVEVPSGLDPALAAALPNAGVSAWFSLEYAAQVQPGQSVLILGATGVTGAVAAQLATQRFHAGRLIVAGRDRRRLRMLGEAGADVIEIGDDLTEQVAALHAARPVDVVLDYLWGLPAQQTLAAFRNTALDAGFHRTRYVQIGSMAGATITLPADVLRSAGVEMVGVGLGSVPAEGQARANTEILPELFSMAAAGAIDVEVSAWPLHEVEKAWTAPTPSGARTVLVPGL